LDAGADVIVVGSAIFKADREASEVVADLKAISQKHLQIFETV
jgi:pentose-5-phosphate-3-epimerase